MSNHNDDPDIESGLQAVFDRHLRNIATTGWSVQVVFPDVATATPYVGYTIGLCSKGLPELVVLGLRLDVAAPILSAIARQIIADPSKACDGALVEEAASVPLRFRQMDHATGRELAVFSKAYADMVHATDSFLQVLLPDEAGIFPGDPGCNPDFVTTQEVRLHAAAGTKL